MLDQPGTFNDDDFEMPLYSQFNEWLLFLCCPLVCFAPRPFIPSTFLCWTDVLFPCFAWLQLHCLQVNPSLLYLFKNPIGNIRSHRPRVYSLLLNLRIKHSPHVEALGVSGGISCFLEGRNLEPAPGCRLEVICFDWSRNDRETEGGCRAREREKYDN